MASYCRDALQIDIPMSKEFYLDFLIGPIHTPLADPNLRSDLKRLNACLEVNTPVFVIRFLFIQGQCNAYIRSLAPVLTNRLMLDTAIRNIMSQYDYPD